MFMPAKGTVSLVIPFMIFMLGAVNELRGRRGNLSSVATQLVGIVGILLFSLSGYAAHYCQPERLASPHDGLIGALLGLAFSYPFVCAKDRVLPQRDFSQ